MEERPVVAAATRLGMSTDPVSLALLRLLDQTVTRLDADGRIIGVWLGRSGYVADVPTTVLDSFRDTPGLDVRDFLDASARPRVLGAIRECLRTGEPVVVEYQTHATGRLLHLVGSCMPCGENEVLWLTRDLTETHVQRENESRRADFEATIAECMRTLVDVDTERLHEELESVMHRIATFCGADAAFVRRFRGRDRVEVTCQWRAPTVAAALPGTSAAGSRVFPWASRYLAEHQVLVMPDPAAFADVAPTDRSNLETLERRGFVWVRVGTARRPIALFGLLFGDDLPTLDQQFYLPLTRLAETILSVVDRHVADDRLSAQRKVFELIARGAPLVEVLGEVCRMREIGRPELVSVAWLDDGNGGLRLVGSTAEGELSNRLVDRIPDDGPEIEALRDGTPHWCDAGDKGEDRLGSIAPMLGANAVGVVPLRSSRGERVTGVLAQYDRSADPLPPGPEEEEGSAMAASLAAIAVERIADLTELAHRATHDSLTGLANRSTFLDRLDQALVRASETGRLVAVLYCDIDRFKDVNDRSGHATGDHLLRVVGERIRMQVGQTASVARLGGDEFAVLLDELRDEDDALAAAERIRAAVAAEAVAPGLSVTVSVGTAVSRSGRDHADGLLRDADMAMYRAKSAGRDRIEVFRERIRREAQHRDRLAQDLSHAIERGEIHVHYQPIIDLDTTRISGLEALARWRHPQLGTVSPDVFVPIAESNGLIGRLGDFVAEQAFGVANGWPGIDLNVNLSAVQLGELDFVDRFRRILQRVGLPPARVVLEITESVLLSQSATTIENLRSLLSTGIGLTLDDFGTGYASLTYLRRFPFRGIKIDRSFIGEVDAGAEDAVIVRMVLELAASLGLDVVAEGVETESQEAELRRLGCPQVQGFLYSPGVPADDLPAVFERFARGDPTTR